MNTKIEKEHPFAFSVVMAVYNVEPFLREAVDSLIAQDFGFENIQLIMVDDGSTDGSGAICDAYAARYPRNVQVIHKENGGVSSARNEGLKYAAGRYLNFMDSDDKITSNTFTKVYNFFALHENEVDVVTIPLEFFDAQRGEHWQNGKFKKGTRVLDLFVDYQATNMFVTASFFKNELKEKIEFDSHLVCGEDMKVLLTVLLRKMKMGVVTGCKYMYRRRSVGEASLIQTSKKKYGWFFDYFTYLVDWAVDYYRNHFGYLPAFVQYELLCDLQWRFTQDYDMSDVLTAEEIERYKERLFSSLRYFDDKYILEQKIIWSEHKCYMLSKKHGCPPTLTERDSNVIVHFGNTQINTVADQYSMIEFIRIANGKVSIEGYTKIFGVDFAEPLEVYLKCNNDLIPCEILPRNSINEYRFGELIYRGIEFRGSIPLVQEDEIYCVQVVLKYRNTKIIKRDMRFGKFSPIGNKYKNSFYYEYNYMITTVGNKIYISRCGRRGRIVQEIKFLRELWRSGKRSCRKAIMARLAYYSCRLFRRKPIWIFSDRRMQAGDNGEAMFQFVQNLPAQPVKCLFSLSHDSPDFPRLKKYGSVVEPLSWKEKFSFLKSDFIISSHFDEQIIRPFQQFSEPYRDISQKQKFIFLQHGVTKDDLSKWLNRYSKNVALFITATKPEYDSILAYDYGYTTKQVKLTGFPRYDLLENHPQKMLTIMPTWRAYLVGGMDPLTGERKEKDGFQNSLYFQMYSRVLSNKRLFDAAEKAGYTIRFLNHPNMAHTTPFANSDHRLVFLNSNTLYKDIFSQSSLVVTDYSSVAFDFAYLRKPVVYFQADYAEFFSGAHTYEKGYFDYEKDGFGEVEYTADALIDRIIEYMKSGCQLKDGYRERIDNTFPFSDKNNCRRVYEKILELNDQE